MKIELMVYNPKTYRHETVQTTEGYFAEIEGLQRFTVRNIHTYPGLQQVDIYADLKPGMDWPTATELATYREEAE